MWRIAYHPRFLKELDDFPEGVQEEIVAMVNLLRVFGPKLKRPRSDTLNGSACANMKELRFDAQGASGALPMRSIPSDRAYFS